MSSLMTTPHHRRWSLYFQSMSKCGYNVSEVMPRLTVCNHRVIVKCSLWCQPAPTLSHHNSQVNLNIYSVKTEILIG